MRRRDVVFRDPSWHFSCAGKLRAAQKETGLSLGMVPVRVVKSVGVKERPEEKLRKHREKLRGLQSQRGMFGVEQKNLAPQAFRIEVEWLCEDKDCNGHRASVLDWGLGELGRKRGREAARSKMEEIADTQKYDLRFYMGNFLRYPNSFGVLGLWYPKWADFNRRRAPLFG